MFESLARWCFNHPWRVIGTWIVTAVVIVASLGAIGPAYYDSISIPVSDSRSGFDVLDEHFDGVGSGLGGTVVLRSEAGVTNPAVRAAFTEVLAAVDSLEGVTVTSPYGPGGRRLVAPSGPEAGRIAYAEVNLDDEIDRTAASGLGGEIVDIIEESGLGSQAGTQVEVGGAALGVFEPPESEAIGIAFAIVVLMVSLGSVMAMGTTIGTALVSVVIGAAGIGLLSNLTTMPEFAVTIGLMIGLGVGIDYALFIITRYRESIEAGFGPEDATAVALDTAGRSVIFAGSTVVVSLLGLLLMGLALIAGVGMAAAFTVAAVMASAVTLLPAAIGLMGERIRTTRWRGIVAAALAAIGFLGVGLGAGPLVYALPGAALVLVAGSVLPARNPLQRVLPHREPKPLRGTIWYRLSRLVQRRPWIFAVGGTMLLLLLASPVLGLRLGFSDEGNYGEEATTRRAYDLISEGFGPGANGPLIIAAETPRASDLEELQGLSAELNATPGVASASPAVPSADGEAAIIQVLPTTAPQDEATERLVKDLRNETIPAALSDGGPQPYITGVVASNIDFTSFLSDRLILFFAVVLGASFVLLAAVFRSLVVPLKAVIMNMLSIGAAYGVIVAIFQWGWFGLAEPAPIEPFMPMMLFAILFGLSMDYEVFLLSRMKEEYEKTGDPVNSVADGLAATASVITAAAAIMVVVFGSFVFEDNRVVQLFGLGLASAVLIDATLVRMLIVPSTMELLGARNWWFPQWLDRLVPNLNIEGGDHQPPEPVDAGGPGQPGLA